MLIADFWRRLREGEIIAFGHPDTVANPARAISVEEWHWLPISPKSDGLTFEGNGRAWYRVSFYPADVVEFWRDKQCELEDRLNRGLTLAEWAQERDPDTFRQLQENDVVLVTGSTEKDEQKREKFEQAQRRLTTLLRSDLGSGQIAMGIAPKGPSDTITPVSDDALTYVLEGVSYTGKGTGGAYIDGKWTPLRVFAPHRLDSAPEDEGAEAPPMKRAGRKPEWDWDEAVSYLIKVANSPDGLPTKQADVEKLLMDYFFGVYGRHPAVSTIRKRVKPWCRYILNADN